jgi:hypothetical protein
MQSLNRRERKNLAKLHSKENILFEGIICIILSRYVASVPVHQLNSSETKMQIEIQEVLCCLL